uniref:Uncharacterized protein n=1 Tax=Trichobilharzia regenti TaxID=157069 RepID=A0AA85IU48_TRIRE|nr:unnamed protein product [Trichobilharzia regenti]
MKCCQATFDIVAVTADNEPTLVKRQFQMSIEEALNRIVAQNEDSQPLLSTSQLTELIGRDGNTGYQGPVLQEFTNIAKSITRYRPRNSSIRNDQNVWMKVIKFDLRHRNCNISVYFYKIHRQVSCELVVRSSINPLHKHIIGFSVNGN